MINMRSDFYKNIGIMQGRLSPSPQKMLQYFPQDTWENEFFLAQKIGLRYIEVIAEEDFNNNNPLWSDGGRERINALREKSGVDAISACINFTLKHSVLRQETLQHVSKFLECVKEIGAKKIILPLLETSEPSSQNFKDFMIPLRMLADLAANCSILLCCETNMNGQSLKSFLNDLNHKNISVCYDVGNCAYLGHNIENDLFLLAGQIQHIHFKDRNAQGHNVLLGNGIVNFREVLKTLKVIDFCGTCTLETSRGNDPMESAKKNLNFLQKFL